jgi:ABC-2 type transport system permease protein
MGAEGSAIYDLGYRHYDGRRLGPWYGTRALFVHSLLGAYGLRRATRSKIVPMTLFALSLLPAFVIAVMINVQPADELPLPYTGYAAVTWLLLSIYVAGQAPQAVSRDLRFRTVALYLSRPLERSQYVLAKYAALTAAVFVFLAIPLTVMFTAALLSDLPVWAQVRGWLAGLAGALLFALVLSGLGLVIAALTPRRGIGVGVIVAVLVLLTGVAGIVQGLAMEAGQRTLAGYAGLFAPISLVDGVQVWLFDAETSSAAGPPGTVGGLVYLATTLAVIAACYGALLLRYRKVLS